jgi:nucleoside-diphosphate-sugar epimerase
VQRIIALYKPVQIYHLAAQSYPSVSWERPQETMDINVGGTISIFEAVKYVRTIDSTYDPVVVVACSSAEYGSAFDTLTEPKIKESAPLLPLHPYGVSKVGQDLLAYQYYKSDAIKTIRARIFNTTGPRKVNDAISDFAQRAVKESKSNTLILKVGNIETRRAILDVDDLINALLLLADKGKYGEAYNICGENAYQMREIIHEMERYLGVNFKIEVDKNLLRPTDEKIIIGNIDKLTADTGWKQNVPLEETVKKVIEYWRQKNGHNQSTI